MIRLDELSAYTTNVLDDEGRHWRALVANCPTCHRSRRAPHEVVIPFSARGGLEVQGLGFVWQVDQGARGATGRIDSLSLESPLLLCGSEFRLHRGQFVARASGEP